LIPRERTVWNPHGYRGVRSLRALSFLTPESDSARSSRLSLAALLQLAAFFVLPFVTAAIYGWALP
jgi:hypothetical protein